MLALGQAVDAQLLNGVSGIRWTDDSTVCVDAHLMTGHPGVFAGGDMVPAERSIAVAVGHGKKAARNIDAYLRGCRYDDAAPKHDGASYESLNTWYYTDADRTAQPTLELARRATSFAEVHSGLDAEHAQFEARRCLSCGNCFECDNCFGMCPDNAIVKLGDGNRFRIDLDYCKGCGICAEECPCGAIQMVPEEL